MRLTETGRTTLNTGTTVPWAGGLDCREEKGVEQGIHGPLLPGCGEAVA